VAARTVPAKQTRSLRDVETRCGSYKAADSILFHIGLGEGLLYGRVPDSF